MEYARTGDRAGEASEMTRRFKPFWGRFQIGGARGACCGYSRCSRRCGRLRPYQKAPPRGLAAAQGSSTVTGSRQRLRVVGRQRFRNSAASGTTDNLHHLVSPLLTVDCGGIQMLLGRRYQPKPTKSGASAISSSSGSGSGRVGGSVEMTRS